METQKWQWSPTTKRYLGLSSQDNPPWKVLICTKEKSHVSSKLNNPPLSSQIGWKVDVRCLMHGPHAPMISSDDRRERRWKHPSTYSYSINIDLTLGGCFYKKAWCMWKGRAGILFLRGKSGESRRCCPFGSSWFLKNASLIYSKEMGFYFFYEKKVKWHRQY